MTNLEKLNRELSQLYDNKKELLIKVSEIDNQINELLKEKKEIDIEMTLDRFEEDGDNKEDINENWESECDDEENNKNNEEENNSLIQDLNKMYKIFLIKKYGSEYENHLGSSIKKFMLSYYGKKFNDTIDNLDRRINQPVCYYGYYEDENYRRCLICNDMIPEGGSGHFYKLSSFKFCDKECVKNFIEQLQKNGILIMKQYIKTESYD